MLPVRGCHPLWPDFPVCSSHTHGSAGPRSLAATRGVSIDVLSSGYLDVSVPRVCLYNPMYSGYKYLVQPVIECLRNNNKLSGGLPHSEIHGSKLILSSPWLIAEYHVFHRLLLPRHSPNALFALDLIQKKKDLRRSRQQKLVRNCHPYSEPKAYFSRLACARHWSNLRWTGLVYLTWTTLFVSAGTRLGGRGNNRVKRLPRRAPN